jgi:integrase
MKSQIRKHLRPRLLNVGVDRINSDLVKDLVVEWNKQGLSRNTIKNLVVTLGLILGKTFGDVKLPKRVNAEEEARWFTQEQSQQIVSLSEGMYKVLFAVAAGTGMREGELFGLQVEDVDLANFLIHVRRSVWEGRQQSPKSRNAYRQVGIDAELVQMLRGYIGERATGYLFRSRNGSPLRGNNTVKRHLWPVLDQLGIRRCGLHAFRHGRVSFLVEHSVPMATIRAWIGHGCDRMVEHYTHSRAEFHAGILAKLPAMVSQEGQQNCPKSVHRLSTVDRAVVA